MPDLSLYQASLQEAFDSLSNYESGDLMALLNIQEALESLRSNLSKSARFKDLVRFVQVLSRFSDTLKNPEKEEPALALLRSAVETLRALFFKEESASKLAPKLNEIAKNIRDFENYQKNNKTRSEAKAQEKENTDDSPIHEDYPENYFNSIVEDSKMILQLSDEIKEHLDIAQITLLDLEKDPKNQENVNKVFRSFHTIKGSSAFLGLKNIEEVAHKMESLLVLIRDQKLKLSHALTDVIFDGIELLRKISAAMEENSSDFPKMKEAFSEIEIFDYQLLLQKILKEHSSKSIEEILQKNKGIQKNKVVPHLNKKKHHNSTYVKVSNKRLNNLIDMVGELVINQSMLKEIFENYENSETQAERIISQLSSITTNIKNLVLSMGMVPIADVFNKLRIVIRNTAEETNKKIRTEISGEETELDRNVVETVYDPLVHIVRNAVDHGIENPEERSKKGKSQEGHISITAQHKGNGIEIVVSDDGGGIDKDRVIQKALEKELIDPQSAENLSEKEIYNLLFLPGFSTAQKVSEISGRGVGLDVVKKNIEAIHGKIEILSKKNEYTRFVIRLPLTLAIIEGFVTLVGKTKYIFPFSSIREIVVPEKQHISTLDDGSQLLFHREHTLPLISAGKVFEEVDFERDSQKTLILILLFEEELYAISVDQVIGKQEIVIKNLGDSLKDVQSFSGGTIFGDGTIGFVVDIEGFLRKSEQEN